MAKRSYRSADQWRAIVRAQASSGLSAQAYCEANELGYASFINWRRRLAGSNEDQEPASAASFIELTPSAGVLPEPAFLSPGESNSGASSFTIELSLGHGIELRILRAG